VQLCSWLIDCATSQKIAGSITDGIFLNFSLTFKLHRGPEVDSFTNRNEHQISYLQVKAAGTWSWQSYHLHVPID
jgi:hypothetical protein